MLLEEIQLLAPKDSKQPRYLQLAEQIRGWILKKQVPAGSKLPNNRQLAEYFKVSPVTMNRSLQELAQAGIIDLKVGSGTYVASASRKANKVLQIGIMCHEAFSQDDYYTSTVLKVFHSLWENYKSDLITLVKTSKEYRQAIEEFSLDGVMVLTPQREDESEIASLHAENYPIVSIGTKFPSLRGCSFGTEHARTASEAVKFLAEKGHKNIGIILHDSQYASIQERFAGYQQGMWESRLPINPDWIIKIPASSRQFCEEQLEKVLRSSHKVTAFIIVSYWHIVPFYSLMGKLGCHIPGDVSLLAFDDPLYASQLNPPLTVYAQPIKQYTEQAVRSLLRQIRNEDFEDSEGFLPYLIERGSVASI